MISEERAVEIIRDSVSSLWRVGLLKQEIVVKRDTVLLGRDTPFDSIALVTLVAELEDRLYQETNEAIYILINEIHTFDVDTPFLTVEVLARYIARQTREQKSHNG